MKRIARSPNRRLAGAVLLLVHALLFWSAPGKACSAFVLREGRSLLLGKNFDHYSSLGLLIVNKRELAKTALLMPPERPASWVSRYGSLTFNQVGREFPMGGMNEMGLVVELMWLDETKYPNPDERPALMELQWIQYQLDNFGTVDEVLAGQSAIRIAQSISPLHFLVCDSSGHAASIEFLEGRCVVHTGRDFEVEVLTNDTYDSCLGLLGEYRVFDWNMKADHTTHRSRDRFLKLARRLEDFEAENLGPARAYAFDMLAAVSVERFRGQSTVWSIVYDPANRELHFKTYENRGIRSVKMKGFDFSADSPALALDLGLGDAGDVSGHFVECTAAVNRRLVENIFKTWVEAGFLRNVPPLQIQFLAAYPETIKKTRQKER